MRIAGSALLTIAATALGLFGAFMLALSGLSMAGPGLTVIEYSDADDSERAIGIGFGVVALVWWLLLLLGAALLGLWRGTATRAGRVTVWIVVGLGAVLVLGALAAVLSIPPPASEYPLPEWNRA